MSKWDALLIVSWGLVFATVFAIGWLHTTYGQSEALQMPLNWIFGGLLFFFMGTGIMGAYRGVWREITGGKGGGGLFIFWLLMILAAGAILRGMLGFFSR